MDLMMGMGMVMGSMMFLIGILWMVIIVLLIYGLMKWISGNKQDTNGKAMQILKERFAQGEITLEEYETMRKKIQE